MYILFNSLLFIFLIITSPYIIFKIIIHKRYRVGIKERFFGQGKGYRNNRPLWIHAASVGEAKVAALIIKEIQRERSNQEVVLSVFTDTGMAMAKKIIPDIKTFFLPIDLPWSVKRTIQNIKPKVFAIIESELWPNTLYIMKKNDVPSLLLNGRVSQKSYENYMKISFFARWIVGHLAVCSMRSNTDRDRIVGLGVDPSQVTVTGNLKYEDVLENATGCDPSLERKKMALPERMRVVLFGCTRDGEEKQLISLFAHILQRYSDVILVVAPRHITRVGELELLYAHRFKTIKQSMIENSTYINDTRIIIVDSLGTLFSLYSICTIAFVGGSLVPFGGQNVLEPAVFGKPVLFGNSMSNFEEEAYELLHAGGALQVESSSDLQIAIDDLLSDKERCIAMGKCARSVIEKNAGALKATRDIIERFL